MSLSTLNVSLMMRHGTSFPTSALKYYRSRDIPIIPWHLWHPGLKFSLESGDVRKEQHLGRKIWPEISPTHHRTLHNAQPRAGSLAALGSGNFVSGWRVVRAQCLPHALCSTYELGPAGRGVLHRDLRAWIRALFQTVDVFLGVPHVKCLKQICTSVTYYTRAFDHVHWSENNYDMQAASHMWYHAVNYTKPII